MPQQARQAQNTPAPRGADVRETARLVGGVSDRTIRRMIVDGRLRAVRIGRRVIVPMSEIERVLEAR